MAKLTLTDLANLQNEATAVAAINTNNAATETALENTLSRDGTTPNVMLSNLDMNSYRITNLPQPVASTEAARYGDISSAITAAAAAVVSQTAAAASATAAATSQSAASTSATAAASSATAAASSATAAASSATSASSSAATATTQATTATTQATTATTQANAASASAASASTSATTATTQASAASASATTASTQATNASTSATNAATSEANALAYAARYKGTSTTSNSISVASKSFTTQASKNFDAGIQVMITSDANPTVNYMHGNVTSYSSTTLVVNVTDIGGSGTLTDWTITVSGTRGAVGAAGSLDFNTLSADTPVSADLLVFGDVSDSNNPNSTTVQAAVDMTILANGSTFPNTGLHILDTNATHDLIIAPGSNLTADRTLTVTTGDADRTLTLTASSSIGGTAVITTNIGSTVQAYDATLASIAALGTAADKMLYTTGVDTWAELAVTSVGRGLLDDTTAAAQLATLTARGQGKETIFIPASAMTSRTTNGPSIGTVEQPTNKNMVKSLDFDTTTQEFAQFSVWFPKSWNLGTVTFQPSYSQLTTAAGGVVFGIAGVALSDTDGLDAAFGTAQTSTDTAGTASVEYQGPESAAITIAGTPAAGDRVLFQINRTVSDGSDTLAQDARLHGIRLFFTTNAATDT